MIYLLASVYIVDRVLYWCHQFLDLRRDKVIEQLNQHITNLATENLRMKNSSDEFYTNIKKKYDVKCEELEALKLAKGLSTTSNKAN